MEKFDGDKYRAAYRRMFRIDELIRTGKCPSAASIAEKLGVTKRTILRDIRYMELDLHAPIRYDKKENGYFYAFPGFSLTDLVYTDDDAAVLMLAWRMMASLFDGSFFKSTVGRAFQSLLEHTGNMASIFDHPMREDIQIALPHKGSFALAQEFLSAIKKQRCVFCTKHTDEILMRPIRLIYAWDNWYLLYITENYRDNTDFQLEKLNSFSKVRIASQSEGRHVKDIIEELLEPLPGMHHGSSTCIEQTEAYGEVLKVIISGRSDSFHLLYRRNPDGSLTFIQNDRTMLSGHSKEIISNAIEGLDGSVLKP